MRRARLCPHRFLAYHTGRGDRLRHKGRPRLCLRPRPPEARVYLAVHGDGSQNRASAAF